MNGAECDINNADWASTFMPWNGTASFSALVLILNEISKEFETE